MFKHAEHQEMAVINDLEDWEEETHAILPMETEQIAALEAAGYVVDLTNGEVSRDPDAIRQS